MKITNASKKLRRFFLVLLILLLAVIAAVVLYVVSRYQSAYHPVDIVDRPDSYVIPEYPVLDPVPAETTAPFETETAAPETEPPHPETTHVPETTQPPETEPDVTTPPVTEPPETAPATTAPPETVPIIVTPPVTYPPVTPVTQPTAPNSPVTSTTAQTQAPVSTQPRPPKTPGKWKVYIKTPIYRVKQIDPDVVNILLLGIDTPDVDIDIGRSDSMIVLSYHKKTGEIKLVSFLRDSLVPIEGHDWNRLNTAYAFGGVGMAINTFNQLFGLDIQHYVAIDKSGVKQIMNLIGEIDIILTQSEIDLYHQFGRTDLKVGVNSLDADEVMMHLSNRSSDNDFGRTRRQRDVLIAIAQKLLKEKSLPEILEVIEYGTTIVGTNIDMMTMISLATSVFAQRSNLNIDTCSVPFSDAYTYAWYKQMAILSFDIQAAAKRVHEILYAN